jgi:hypothetical protein
MLDFAIRAAREAGAILNDYQKRGFVVTHKGAINLVTEHTKRLDRIYRLIIIGFSGGGDLLFRIIERRDERSMTGIAGGESGAKLRATGWTIRHKILSKDRS